MEEIDEGDANSTALDLDVDVVLDEVAVGHVLLHKGPEDILALAEDAVCHDLVRDAELRERDAIVARGEDEAIVLEAHPLKSFNAIDVPDAQEGAHLLQEPHNGRPWDLLDDQAAVPDAVRRPERLRLERCPAHCHKAVHLLRDDGHVLSQELVLELSERQGATWLRVSHFSLLELRKGLDRGFFRLICLFTFLGLLALSVLRWILCIALLLLGTGVGPAVPLLGDRGRGFLLPLATAVRQDFLHLLTEIQNVLPLAFDEHVDVGLLPLHQHGEPLAQVEEPAAALADDEAAHIVLDVQGDLNLFASRRSIPSLLRRILRLLVPLLCWTLRTPDCTKDAEDLPPEVPDVARVALDVEARVAVRRARHDLVLAAELVESLSAPAPHGEAQLAEVDLHGLLGAGLPAALPPGSAVASLRLLKT